MVEAAEEEEVRVRVEAEETKCQRWIEAEEGY